MDQEPERVLAVRVMQHSASVALTHVCVFFSKRTDQSSWQPAEILVTSTDFWIDEKLLQQARSIAIEALRRHESPDVIRCPHCKRLVSILGAVSAADVGEVAACGTRHEVSLRAGSMKILV